MIDPLEETIETDKDQILNSTEQDPDENEPLSGAEIFGWAEFCCWTVVVLIPFLLYVNGAAASFDQLVVRSGLSIVAITGGIALTARRLMSRI